MSTVAVGDIHGNAAALENLLAALLPELDREDTLVFLGDYIDRGPDSRGCVERIVNLQQGGPCTVVALLGNHARAASVHLPQASTVRPLKPPL